MEEKLRAKALSLERSNEMFKQKNNDLTKKLSQEQEASLVLKQKNTRLQQKITQLERSLKESQATHVPSTQKKQDHPQPTRPQEDHEQQHSVFDPEEKPLDLADLKEEDKESTLSGPNQSPQQPNDSLQRSPPQRKNQRATEPLTETHSNTKAVAQNLAKTKFPTSKSSKENHDTKKATLITQVTASKPAVNLHDEVKVLLGVLETFVQTVKSTPPSIGSPKRASPIKPGLSPGKSSSEVASNSKVDIGEMLYPMSQTLLPALTELMHLLNKPFHPKDLSGLLELFYQLLSYSYKTRNAIGSPIELSSRRGLAHTSDSRRDLLAEMVSVSDSQSFLKRDMTPQTEHWRKLSRNSKVSTSILAGTKSAANTIDPCLQLFPNIDIQKEVVRILSVFVANSETVSSTPDSEESKEELTSALKYTYILRVLSNLCTLYLTRSKREHLGAVQGLTKDLNSENHVLAGCLKEYFVEKDGIGLVFIIINSSAEDYALMNAITDLFLLLGSNGDHYLPFIQAISTYERIKVPSSSNKPCL